jgi:hypothetical protein
MTILPQHRDKLAASAIAEDVIEERGYRSAERKVELRDLGFGEAQRRPPALVIPVCPVLGDPFFQARSDDPRLNANGKAIKYETPSGVRMALDAHPRIRDKLDDPSIPLFITEGILKADSAVSRGLCCVALLGVWNWRGTNEKGGKVALADWEAIALNGRRVYIAFDSDVMQREEVAQALNRLAAFLDAKSADVYFVYLPALDGGVKCGLDDYFASEKSVDDLLACATAKRRDPQPTSKPPEPTFVSVPDTTTLLAEIESFLTRFVRIHDRHGRTLLALWVVHSWAFDAADSTPYVIVLGPTMRTGKSRLFDVLKRLVRAPWGIIEPSEAVLFRKIERDCPTLLLDEIDAVFNGRPDREPLRAILNEGNHRGATVPRCVGDSNEIVDFAVFCPKALAGIDNGKLPATLRDRSVIVRMKRKLRSESVGKLRGAKVAADAEALRDKLASWAHAHVEALRSAEPKIPDELNDRAADAWEPLLAIAERADEAWIQRARAAATALAEGDVDDDTLSSALLDASRAIFADDETLATTAILKTLNDDDEAPFAAMRDGRGINARGLASLLRPFGIRPRVIRLHDGSTPRGYRRDDFADVWARYPAQRKPTSGDADEATQRPSDPPSPTSSATSATSALQSQIPGVSDPQQDADVADGREPGIPDEYGDVADVADSGHETGSEDDATSLLGRARAMRDDVQTVTIEGNGKPSGPIEPGRLVSDGREPYANGPLHPAAPPDAERFFAGLDVWTPYHPPAVEGGDDETEAEP